MTTIAATDKLRELDEDLRRAWREYHEHVQGLSGAEYEQTELEAWELLQEELQELERQRAELAAAPD